MSVRPLVHPLLEAHAIAHGFGVRGATAPEGVVRPRQVHGARIVTDAECGEREPPAADGVVSRAPDRPIAIVTADCVPILMADSSGSAVAALHAGWRGLAAGVVEAGVAALRALAPPGSALLAVIGPHIGSCCYEVDPPVVDALRRRYPVPLHSCLRPSRPGHTLIDLGGLAGSALVAAGLARADVAVVPGACTHCDSERFHSYRRDGPRAGRLIHYISARPGQA